ncbi:MAG: aldehyde dehydrogenase family protein [Burkholderiales bacterium]|nr:MAG: aldehyde dehydrogenase family protein [Burkholderiales bacterium]
MKQGVDGILTSLGLDPAGLKGGDLEVRTPIDGAVIGRVACTPVEQIDAVVDRARAAHLAWRSVPAPRRGELIRLFGEQMRRNKDALGRLVTLEAGKIREEGRGEVQEMIDICDFALGLSRQLYGLTIASERPGHRMMETWHPLGPVAVISAFNFPVAVWSWNFALAVVCGDSVIWKPSEKTPITALACRRLFEDALAAFGDAPADLLQVVVGDKSVGERLVDDPGVPLVSATGSCRMGREVAPRVAARLGQTLLELGGNNAMIVAPSADLELTVRAALFSAVGTAGQRCTSLRRVIAHERVCDELVARLKRSYGGVRIGNPLEDQGVLVGPLIDRGAYSRMRDALQRAASEGGTIFGGARVMADRYPDAYYVEPALVEMPSQTETVREETFAPILYVMRYREFDEAVAMHNDVSQGLSSCIFTNDVREAEAFMSAAGSDCGIVNVNIGPSGAEIGGAFGGEKDTGGGRESGSDAWKRYMRRATNTVNYSRDLPLAQGIRFDV